jgi:hypothetical protein
MCAHLGVASHSLELNEGVVFHNHADYDPVEIKKAFGLTAPKSLAESR